MADEGAKPKVHLPVLPPTADKHDLDRQLDYSGLYNHGLHTLALDQMHQLATFVFTGLELMIMKGIITREEMRIMREKVAEKLDETHWTRSHGQQMMNLEPGKSKYELSGNLVDCDARMHLCKGVCCHMDHPLQLEDVVEGVVKWDHSKPYWIRQHPNGRCVHVDLENGGKCDVFEHRPKVCRMYSCEKDDRVWIDFEKRIPNSESIEVIFSKPAKERDAMISRAGVERVAVDLTRPIIREKDKAKDDKPDGGA